MKINIDWPKALDAIDADFCGLAVDKDGDLWFLGYDGAAFVQNGLGLCFHDETKTELILKYGPFTKFEGSITLSND